MKRLFIAVALLLAGIPSALADEAGFRAEMIKALEKRHPGAAFVPDGEALVVKAKGEGWDGRVINLHRIYLYCQNATTDDCDTVKREFLDNTSIKPDDPTPSNLRIIVRDQPYVDYLERMEKEGGKPLAIRRQIGEDLYALLVSDSATMIALVGVETLADMGLSAEDAWNRGWRQTVAILPVFPEPEKFREQAMAFESDQYLASLAADLATWQKVSDAVGPDLFLTVVSDQFVFAGPMADGPGLEEFRETVEEDCRAQPRCVSPNIYRFRDGRWVIAR